MKTIPKIILLIETTHAYGQGLIRGIAQYSKCHGPWSFHRESPFYGHTLQHKNRVSNLKKIKADGIIVREPSSDEVRELMKLEIPIIISPNIINPDIPTIIPNTKKIAELAAQHFLEKGFKHFAYCGFETMPWSINRNASFVNIIKKNNFNVHSFFLPIKNIVSLNAKDPTKLVKWLQSLPKPVGLMTCNDDMGRAILEICAYSDISVPEQIAVIGVDDDELICDITVPPLSSVALNSEKAGFQAAELMGRLMRGEKMNGQIIIQEPSRVVPRQSTDVIAVNDLDVIKAISYIRKYYNEPISVDNVANEVNLSRRHLYKKFVETLGHSVHKEIKSMRIKHICKMLVESDLSIYQITMSLGFTEIEHISRYFQKEKGLSPQEYRNKFRT